ncbi:MAG: tyrosine--tRNA ligase [Anaerolineaceae bacterium]|nr:tyrosine--tRNA ligase [Anaerolineaceae bacterium]
MNIDEQVALLMQGTEYGDEALYKAMAKELKDRLIEAEKEGRPLRIYCGFDPRTSNLHLGHTVPMRKLRQFQELGHEVTFVVGDYTSLIGDPSDKDVLRPRLTKEEVDENAQTYADQAFKILDPEKTKIRRNSEWLSTLSFKELIELASNFTIQQFMARENFKKRWEKGEAIYLHETFYSIMQGYDAYALRTDVQVGGTDQLFNIITAGRKLMNFLGEKPNIGLILGILPGTDGVVKMSKSLGNHIPINTNGEDMYGKVMSIPDMAMPSFFRLVTRWTPPQIVEIEKELAEGKAHPRDVKMKLAKEIVSSLYGDAEAEAAQEAFIKLFQQKEDPDEMPVYTVKADQPLLDILEDSGMIGSRGEGRRLLKQNGVKLDGKTISDPFAVLVNGGVLKIGKRKFLKIEVK